MGKLPIILILITTSLSYEILYSFNCGSQTVVQSSLLAFNSDEMYEGLKSKSHKKQSLPAHIKDPNDIQLLSYERTTEVDSFSYFFKLTGADHYFLLLKFIEVLLGLNKVVHEKPNQRVFQVRLGDQVVSEVDIAREVGKGNILNKWIEFQLKDDVLYLNRSTLPVLNGYIYPKQTMRFTLSKMIGQPKLQALILLKGSDSTSIPYPTKEFLNEYTQNQKRRLNKRQELTSQKYQRDFKFTYKHLTGRQKFNFPKDAVQLHLNQFFCLKTMLAGIAALIVILHELIYKKLHLVKEQESKEQ